MTVDLLLGSVCTVLAALFIGIYCVAAMDSAVYTRITGAYGRNSLMAPLQDAASLWYAPKTRLKHPIALPGDSLPSYIWYWPPWDWPSCPGPPTSCR
ncbi:hypothetical protein RE428_32820 [Marinobacter nanhaiticus D15-8W]|uniref:hypothetical protein n=1 Tax=Marinobacter nanhaiticus TaxID=1305740 RepID=UPI00291DC334|nr:hypothetical protein RE428_32820 [Marinobacter nanhaiticus D15-8W]